MTLHGSRGTPCDCARCSTGFAGRFLALISTVIKRDRTLGPWLDDAQLQELTHDPPGQRYRQASPVVAEC